MTEWPEATLGSFANATVCRRGHVYDSGDQPMPPTERCAECGARLLSTCPTCEAPIRGRFREPRTTYFDAWNPSNFCHSCGAPFPWASREARIYELLNLLDEQELDEPTRLTVSEQLDALRNPDLGEDEQLDRWRRVKALAPGLMDAGQRILESIMAAWIKRELEL